MSVLLEVRLSEVLGRHRIKQVTLAREAGLRPATVHGLFNNRRERVELDQLGEILAALHRLTGRRYELGDIIATVYTDTDTDQRAT